VLRRQVNLRYLFYLAAPTLVYLIFAMLSRLNIGVRHLLPIYPFLFVLIGGCAALIWKNGTVLKRCLLGAAAFWYALSCALTYPNYISFFNEAAGGAKNGHNRLIDSKYLSIRISTGVRISRR